MAKKRVTRKQLLKEPDEFITFSNRMIRLGVAYKQQLMIAVGIFCAAVLVYVGTQYVSGRSRAKAFNLLENAVSRYDRELAQSGPLKALSAVEADFELILDKYGSNAGGRLARLTFAQYHFAAGAAEPAIELYAAALADFQDDLLYRSLVDGRDKLSQKWSFKTEPPGKGTELSGMYVNFNLELNRSMV